MVMIVGCWATCLVHRTCCETGERSKEWLWSKGDSRSECGVNCHWSEPDRACRETSPADRICKEIVKLKLQLQLTKKISPTSVVVSLGVPVVLV